MKNIHIGIKFSDSNADPEIFYAGSNPAKLREKHAKLLENNKDGAARFFQIQNPILTPLQHVKHNPEDHPDQVAAHARRLELAKPKKEAATVQAEIKTETESQ